MTEPLLEVKDVEAGYGSLQVLFGVGLTLYPKEFVALVGPNGSGKSTLLRTIQGLLEPTRGEIRFDGERIEGLPPHRVVELGLVLVPEGRRLFFEMSVRENLELGAYPRRPRGKLPERLERVLQIFPALKEKGRVVAGALSGGEQQMLALARGLMADPKLLLLDDPFLGLAPKAAGMLEQTIKDLPREGVSVLMVGQHVRRLLALSDRAYLLQAGRIPLEGEGEGLLEHPLFKRSFLG